jgi:hypothetical protein
MQQVCAIFLDPGALPHVTLWRRDRTSLEPVSSLFLVLNIIGLDPLALVE